MAGLLFSSSLEDIGVVQGGSLHRRLRNKREKMEGSSLEESSARGRRHSGDSATPTNTVLGLSLSQGETDPHKIARNLGDDAKILSGSLRKSRRSETLGVNSKLAHTHRDNAPTHTFAQAEAEGADSSDEETRPDEDKVDNDLAAIFDLEDLDLDSEGAVASRGAGPRGQCNPGQSNPAQLARPAKRMGIQTGYDPLSLLAAESECEVAEVTSEGGGGQTPPGVRRDLAEEIEMYMNHLGSPLSSRAPSSVDLRSPASPAAAVHQHEARRGSLPHCSSRALSVPRSHTYHSHQQVAHSLHSSHAPQANTPTHARARLWSSPAYPPDAAPLRGDERDRDPHSGMASPSPSPSRECLQGALAHGNQIEMVNWR